MSPAHNPWRWIPTLYFTQGLPNVMVVTVSTVMYKNLGVSNTEIALYTSWLYLPWVIKPLWSPLVELLGSKRQWVLAMQFLMGVALALVAFTLPGPQFLQFSLAMFWLVAFASATHDIAADGFYMLGLPRTGDQAAFVGVRSTFFRLAMIAGQGALVYVAGVLGQRSGQFATAWATVLVALGLGLVLVGLYHAWALPRPAGDRSARARAVSDAGQPGAGSATGSAVGSAVGSATGSATGSADSPAASRSWLASTLEVFAAFFRKPMLWRVLAFLLLYRFAEAQLLRLVTPFMLDPAAAGGLGLRTQDVGVVYGTVGVLSLTVGGLLGGWFISRVGLKRALWPMALCLNVPNLVYVWLALAQPQSLWLLSAGVAVEQFGYGFGFAAYMVFMLMVASTDAQGRDNPHKTAHYALCTGFMALGMMLPGMWSGWLQDRLGYAPFFVWVCVATFLSFAACAWVRIDPKFGRKEVAMEPG